MNKKPNNAEAIQLLRRFQDHGEPTFIDEWGNERCLYCARLSWGDPKDHNPDCPWVELVQLDLT